MQKLGWWSVSLSYSEGAALDHIKRKGISIEEYARQIAGSAAPDNQAGRPHPRRAELEQGIARDLRAYAEKHNIIVVA